MKPIKEMNYIELIAEYKANTSRVELIRQRLNEICGAEREIVQQNYRPYEKLKTKNESHKPF